jgi:hypothetical protein
VQQTAQLPDRSGAPLFVPVVVYVQKLTRIMRATAAASNGSGDGNGGARNLLIEYLAAQVAEGLLSAASFRMLQQAFKMRSLLVLFDGVDEAAGLREQVEHFAVHELVASGHRVVLTSRPEGIRLREYKRGFVIMNLKPLTREQQEQAIEAQLHGNEFYEHLSSFSRIRGAYHPGSPTRTPSFASCPLHLASHLIQTPAEARLPFQSHHYSRSAPRRAVPQALLALGAAAPRGLQHARHALAARRLGA